ncbi:oligosaccharide flippase family protein [Colwellia sp. RE-S-Sl-9]
MRTSVQAAMSAINLYSEYFLGLIISLTIARNLTTDDYGVYSSIIWISGLVTLAINSGLGINATKFIAEFTKRDPKSLPAIVAYFWRIQHIRILIVSAIALVILLSSYGNTNIEPWLLTTLFICAVIKADYMFRMAVFKGVKKFDVIAKTSVIANPFNIALVLLCAYLDATLNNFILVYCVACLIYGVSARLYTKQLPSRQWDNGIVQEHKKRIVIQMLSATGIVFFGTLIFKQSQVLVLEKSDFFTEAGFFNIAFLLSTAAITLVPGIYQEILLPKITDAVENGDVKSQVEQAERYLITLSMAVAIPMVIYADVIIEVLYGERYQEAAFSLQIMVVLKAIMTLNQGANLTLISHDKQFDMVKVNAGMFVFAMILSLFIVPFMGLTGALIVYGTLVFILLFSYSMLARSCKYKMISVNNLLRIIVPALISTGAPLIINQFLSGILSSIIGSISFVVLYFYLLFIFRGYDRSVVYILKQIEPKSPKKIKVYINWGIKQLMNTK